MTYILKFKQSFAALTLFALSLQMFSFAVFGQSETSPPIKTVPEAGNPWDPAPPKVDPKTADPWDPAPQRKISPDLEAKADELGFGFREDETQRVIIQLKSETGLNEMFGNNLSKAGQKELFAKEVQNNTSLTGILVGDLAEFGGSLKKSFKTLGLVSAELPLSRIRQLSERDEVAYISPDRETAATGHIGDTTGFNNNGIVDLGDSNPSTWLGGANKVIAVIDSGVDRTHRLMQWEGVGSKVWNYDFTGEGTTADLYGHGTHVASLASGQTELGGDAYHGLADGAQVLSLRALKGNGTGNVSHAIAALDWAVQQKVNNWWNINVINMSLGTGPRDSYVNDPLCQAARRAVNAGIVVVVSAGNNGKNASGSKVYGGISSPGIEPSVITVGAANTFGTNFRSDDSVTTYSSRGPTRGYKTLTNGARKYDNLIKPDLIAPGNKLIGARSTTTNTLIQSYPQLATGNATLSTDKLMYLSGTSMAAPIVAAAAVDLLQTNPNLTPNLVKAILMYSAQPLPGYNTLEQGAGELNVDGAVRLARLVKATLPTTNGSALLKSSLPASQTSPIWGQTVYWSKGVVTNFGFLSGNDLMVKWQGMYAKGVLMGDGTPFSGSAIAKSTSLTSGTLTLYQGAIKNNGVLMGDGTLFLSANAMGSSPTPFVNSQGVLISDGVLMGDGVLIGDSQAILGDNTTCMLPAP